MLAGGPGGRDCPPHPALSLKLGVPGKPVQTFFGSRPARTEPPCTRGGGSGERRRNAGVAELNLRSPCQVEVISLYKDKRAELALRSASTRSGNRLHGRRLSRNGKAQTPFRSAQAHGPLSRVHPAGTIALEGTSLRPRKTADFWCCPTSPVGDASRFNDIAENSRISVQFESSAEAGTSMPASPSR